MSVAESLYKLGACESTIPLSPIWHCFGSFQKENGECLKSQCEKCSKGHHLLITSEDSIECTLCGASMSSGKCIALAVETIGG